MRLHVWWTSGVDSFWLHGNGLGGRVVPAIVSEVSLAFDFFGFGGHADQFESR